MTLLLAALITAPNPALTPGVMVNVAVSAICRPGYATEARKKLTRGTKERVWKAYGVERADRSRYRLDHYVPISAGGCAYCAANLWPEPVADSVAKDRLEARLHRDLCAGRITLGDVPGIVGRGWK